MSEKELEFTTRLTREDVAGVIEALVEGLKDGRLKIHKSNEALELEVPRVVDLEIEAKVSKERAKFEIEVSWRTNRAENPDAPEGDPSPQAAAKSKKKAASAEKAKVPAEALESGKSQTLKKAKSTVKKVTQSTGSATKASTKAVAKTVKKAAGKAKKTVAKVSGSDN